MRAAAAAPTAAWCMVYVRIHCTFIALKQSNDYDVVSVACNLSYEAFAIGTASERERAAAETLPTRVIVLKRK